MVDNDVCLIDDPIPWAQRYRGETFIAETEVAGRGYAGINSHFMLLHPNALVAKMLVEMGATGSYLPYTNSDQDVIETMFAARKRMPQLPNHTHSKTRCGAQMRLHPHRAGTNGRKAGGAAVLG